MSYKQLKDQFFKLGYELTHEGRAYYLRKHGHAYKVRYSSRASLEYALDMMKEVI